MSEKEWGKLSSSARVNRIEQRTCEFIRHVYYDNPEAAEEILKRIGFVRKRNLIPQLGENRK